MSANILLIECEQSSADRVRDALVGENHRLEIAANLDAAVNLCAHFEPGLVVLTSDLPQVRIEDAITQFRARAGLRVTPFLILMSDYRGENSKADAATYGAQEILARPFSDDQLFQRVDDLLKSAAGILTTQAVPQETLDALRRGADGAKGGTSFSSEDLFADILSDVERSSKPAQPVPDSSPVADTSGVDRALAEVLGGSEAAEASRPSTTETDVDAMLSETLAGLEVTPSASPPKTPEVGPGADDLLAGLGATAKGPSVEVDRGVAGETPDDESPEFAEEPVAGEAPPSQPTEAAESDGEPPDDDEVSPEPAGTTFGQYVLEEHIASGGMAQVYKARMLGLEGFQKTVAVKRILPHLTSNEEFVKMFVDEAKLAAQLNHPNIIHIYDLGKIDRSHFIAMEYIEGRDLRSILDLCRKRDVQVPIPIALHIVNLLAGALDYAHKKRDFDNRDLGLVHRDVSPQNVLIASSGEIKLCDFGIAKAASKASHTRAGALKGKLQYMSPEQAWGKDIDHRSDVFSLGLVLYEMLTALKVFAGDSELSILEQVRNPKVSAPSTLVETIPADVDGIALKALEPERDRRYQSARKLQRDCEEVLKHYNWTPDTEQMIRFFTELESGAAITTYPIPELAATGATGVGAASAGGLPSGEGPSDRPAVSPPPPADGAVESPLLIGEPAPQVLVADQPSHGGGGKWIWIAIAVVVLLGLAGGWWFFMGPGADGGEPSAPASSLPETPYLDETPTPEPEFEDGLLNEAELLERAREVASAELVKQEEELRSRLEKEFPTPTPLPPTPTASDTPTETPVPSPTPTRRPPTPTRIPPTVTPIPPTPTPAVTEGEIVTPGAGVIAPVLLHKVDPEYPPIARKAGVAGDVIAQALVGINGQVEDVRIVEVSQKGVGFERATEEAVRQWRYRPATKHGVKVRVWLRIKINLTLN